MDENFPEEEHVPEAELEEQRQLSALYDLGSAYFYDMNGDIFPTFTLPTLPVIILYDNFKHK